MVGTSTVVDLTLSAKVEGQPSIEDLTAEIERLNAQLVESQQNAVTGGKDWLDYSTQVSAVAESLANAVSSAEDIAIKTAEIGAAIAVYQKYRALVEGVRGAYAALQGAIQAGALVAGSAWDAASAQALKVETRIASLVSRFASLELATKGFGLAGAAVTIADFVSSESEANEQTRLLTEQIGGLSTSLQLLDPASKPVQIAKERFDELYKASLALKQSAPELVDQYKQFFDATASSNLSIQQSGRLLTDYLQVQKSLRATESETKDAQIQLNDAFETGLTTIPKLGAIFGSSLNPALDAVSKSMGITRADLENLINSGQVGAESVLPALAAAARNVTSPLSSSGDAAKFSSDQFEAMGISVNELAGKSLPGAANALQRTGIEIKNTVDASIDPIGAAIERIENFGSRVAAWSERTKQSIADAFSGPDIKQAINTGIQESIFALDFLLVGLKDEFNAVGESIGVVAGAATTATNPIDDLRAIWSGMAGDLLNTRDRLNEYVNALEGVDNAQGRTADGAKALTEQLKTLPEIKLPEALKEIVDKLTATESASSAVGAVWKELGTLDFTGGNIRNLLLLRQTIQDVSDRTQDATGTQAAFSSELSKLPVDKLTALLQKTGELGPRLKQAGDDGALLDTVLGAAFDKLGLNAAEAGGKITRAGQDAAATFALIANSADTNGAQIRSALNSALNAAKTKSDVALIQAEFAKLAQSGQASGQLIADGQAAVARRLADLQNQIPGIGAAFKDLGVSSSQQLRAVADAASASFAQLQAGNATVQELQQGFLAWAEAEIKAANAAGLPIPATIQHRAETLGLVSALGELANRYREMPPEQEASAAASERAAVAAGHYTASLKAVADAQLARRRAEIDLLVAEGDTETAQRKIIELTQLEAQWTQTLATSKQAEIAAEISSTQKKLEAKQAASSKTQADEQEISALRLKLSALDQEAKAERASTQSKLASGPATQAAVAAIRTHNQALLVGIDYQTRINAIRNKGLSDSERDAKLASDAETLLAKATLARFDLSSKANADEIKANQTLRQGLIQRADALAGQVQSQEKAISLLERLRTESVTLLQDTAKQADIDAKITADDAPARKTMAGLVEWAKSQTITIPVRFSGSGGGSQGAGLIDELNRRSSAE